MVSPVGTAVIGDAVKRVLTGVVVKRKASLTPKSGIFFMPTIFSWNGGVDLLL